jgi:hypothetical protein
MAIPNQLKSARMTDATIGSLIDNHVGDLETALCDILGLAINTDVTAAPFSITTAGVVTALRKPLRYKPHVVKASKSGNQSIPDSTSTVVLFDTDDIDSGGMHDTGVDTGRLHVITTGIHHIVPFIEWATGPTSGRLLTLRKNGVTNMATYRDSANSLLNCQQHHPDYWSLVAGDYVELVAFQASGGAVNINNGSSFAMMYVGEL